MAVIVHVLSIVGASLFLALLLRFGHEVIVQDPYFFLHGEILFVLISALAFYGFGVLRALWRYSSLPDLVAIIKAVTVAVGSFWIVISAVDSHSVISDGAIPLIQWLVLIVMLGGPRLMMRAAFEEGASWRNQSEALCTPTLIAGATGDAAMFIRAMHESAAPPYQVLVVRLQRLIPSNAEPFRAFGPWSGGIVRRGHATSVNNSPGGC